MRIFVKFISLVLVLNMLTGLAAFADETSVGKDDVKGTTYEEAVSVLSGLEIMKFKNGDEFGINDSMTRADFAAAVATLVNINANMNDGKKYFYDVDKDNKNAGYINVLASLGYMTGDKQGYFHPEEMVSYQQAVKTLVTVLGYGITAENKGGYPMGYLVVASEKGLTSKMKIKSGDLSRGEAAQLFFNSLDVDIQTNDGFGNMLTYSVEKGKTALSEYHKIWKDTGVVAANELTGLTSTIESVGKGNVVINNVTYSVGNTKAANFLGYKTEFYFVQESPSAEKVIKYIKAAKDCMSITIDADKIEEYTNRQYKYFDNNDKLETADLSKTCDVVFNKKACLSDDKLYYMPQSGNVTLIDNDNDGDYDAVIISSYKTYIVDSVDDSNKSIIDRYAQTKLKLDGTNKKYSILQDGEKIITDNISKVITKGSMITVFSDKEKTLMDSSGQAIMINGRASTVIDDDVATLYTIIIENENKITGKVSEVDNAENAVSINNVIYKIAPDYLTALQTGNSEAVQINTADEDDFYLDSNGRIVATAPPHMPVGQYGFLMTMGFGSGVDNLVQIKVLDSKGERTILNLADKVKLNDVSIIKENIKGSTLLYDAANNLAIRQLIYYNLDTKGNISELRTATLMPDSDNPNVSSDNLDTYQSIFSLDKQFRSTDQSKQALGTPNNTLLMQYLLTGDTKVFVIPAKNENSKLVADAAIADENYALRNYSYFGQDTYYTNLDIYDVGRDLKTAAIVVWDIKGGSAAADIDYKQAITIVDKVSQVIDEDENVSYKLSGFQGGQEVEMYFAEEDVKVEPDSKYPTSDWNKYNGVYAKDLKQGDIIQYTTDGAGKMKAFKLLFRDTAMTTKGFESSEWGWGVPENHIYVGSYTGLGQVMASYANVFYVNTRNGAANTYRPFVIGGTVYTFNTESKKIAKSDYTSIQKGDYLFVQYHNADFVVALVIKRKTN